MRPWRCLAAVAALAVMGACEEDDITAPPVISSIDIAIGDCAGLLVDETCQLLVTVRGSDGEEIHDAQLDWFTPDITVATVDFQGRVTGVREGSATIFAKSAAGPVSVCQLAGVICDSLTLTVDESDPGPGPPP
ncbi:MAG TPA: Ig-like domain-containing protein [Gemmatimonadota bacterium]|nr:Ig-like domain-containing protein [Gemmatimonadota bacterium]